MNMRRPGFTAAQTQASDEYAMAATEPTQPAHPVEKRETVGSTLMKFAIAAAILGLIWSFMNSDSKHSPTKPPTSVTKSDPAAELAELERNCFLVYERMCRDETEVFWASFRGGLNEGLRGN